MKNPVGIALGVLLCATLSQAEPRTFTNTEGTSIEAELVRVEGEEAVLKLANLKLANVPLASLSKADEAYVQAWWEENKDKLGPMDVRLAIDKNTERIDHKVSKSGASGGNNRNNQHAPVVKKMQKDDIHYACVLKSYVKKEVTEINVEYTIYKRVTTRDKDGSKSEVEEIDGSATIRRLEAFGSATFETDAVPCLDESQTGGKGPDTRRSETVEGFVVTLSAGGKDFLKRSYPENYIERLEEEEKRENER